MFRLSTCYKVLSTLWPFTLILEMSIKWQKLLLKPQSFCACDSSLCLWHICFTLNHLQLVKIDQWIYLTDVTHKVYGGAVSTSWYDFGITLYHSSYICCIQFFRISWLRCSDPAQFSCPTFLLQNQISVVSVIPILVETFDQKLYNCLLMI